jgi:RimJ/RimL family protein N-acetyltransferase
MISLVTGRLVLRRWRDDDVVPISAINADPEVMRWIGGGSVRDEHQTKAAIETFERRWDQHGFGMFALELRATGELIGFTGLAVPQLLPEVMPAVEIGWRLGRAFWGRGLATEAAAAALRFGLIDRDLGQIISIAQAGNGASERVMGKLGMRLARETVDPACDRPVRVYAVTKAQYLAAGPRSNGDGTPGVT